MISKNTFVGIIKGAALIAPAAIRLIQESGLDNKLNGVMVDYTSYDVLAKVDRPDRRIGGLIPIGWAPYAMVEATDLVLSWLTKLKGKFKA